MALTPKERLRRRQTDPYFGLADQIASGASVLEQKQASLAAAQVEKKREQDPAQAIADEAQGVTDPTNYLDIAESAIRQGGSQLFDFVTGGTRSNEEIRQAADEAAGVTPEGRQRLVSDPQQRVIESLAQGDYLGAIPEAIKAGPGTLADSAQVVPELAAGALLTRVGGNQLLKRRGEKAKEGVGRLFDRVGEERRNLTKLADGPASRTADIIKSIPKAAGQVSIATADMTQRQINDFRELHGQAPTREEAATMYAINMATMLPTPAIIKNLFIPDFKKTISKEIRQLPKNITSGANWKSVAKRVVDGTKAITAAAGAEAGQEYFQTWAENLNVQMSSEQRKNFFESALEIIGDSDNQLQALAGSYLGFGAGGTAKVAITAPAVAAGATVDTAKGTAKTTVKAATKVTKAVGRQVQKATNAAGAKILSQEELDVIRGEFESRKELVDVKVKQFESAIDLVKSAKSIDALRRQPGIAEVVSAQQERSELTDDQLQDRRTLEKFKADIIRAYRGDIGFLKTQLEASNVADIGKAAGKNVVSKSAAAAREAMEAVAPAVTEVVSDVKRYGKKAVKAVRELRSSTALGMIELAANAGKEETKQIVEAGKTLSLDDLERTAAVISEFKPDIARQLRQVAQQKQRVLEKTGFRAKTIVNQESLDPVIRDVVSRQAIDGGEVAAVSSAINRTVAGNIEDIQALQDVEFAVAQLKDTDAFKTQTQGAMSRAGMAAVERKLARVRKRLEKEPGVVDKAKKAAKKAADVATPVVKKAATAAAETVAAKAAPELKISTTLRTVTEAAVESFQDPVAAKSAVEAVPVFAKQMKKNGVQTRSDFLKFISEFPGIEENVEFFKQLEQEFPSDISANEVYDNLRTRAISAVDKAKAAYAEMYPECKI